MLNKKVDELVQFLSAKYVTGGARHEGRNAEEHYQGGEGPFPVIFRKVCDCVETVFGIEVKEVNPASHSYMHVKTRWAAEGCPGRAQDQPPDTHPGRDPRGRQLGL